MYEGKWSDVCPILGICALHLTHPSAHTVGSQCCCARGLWYWGWRESWLFSPPTDNSWRTWDSNLRPLGYKSDSLSIRPRLPLNKSYNKQTNPPLICVLPNNHLDREISFLRRPSVTVLVTPHSLIQKMERHNERSVGAVRVYISRHLTKNRMSNNGSLQ